MRLASFIRENLEAILEEWERFARSLASGRTLGIEALRDDAANMLRFVAEDIDTEQTRAEEIAKAKGHGRALPAGQLSAGHHHGIGRAVERFSLVEVVSEYRALRASVTRRWLDAVPVTQETVAQLVRFNEAIDQILAEGVAKFAERLDKEADLFTATIAHDLSNPVHAVSLSAQRLLVSRSLSEAERAAVERIGHASERLAGMLADLRDFTRTRLGGTLVLQREPCDVGDLLRQVVDELAPGYPNQAITLEVRGTLSVALDRKRVLQLLSNLVANALQHGAEDGPVQVRAVGDTDSVSVEVHNDGPAIPPERLKPLFDPLNRVPSRGDAHLGLGLYIAEQIALAHGGSIAVHSSDAAGTRFTVCFPRDRTATAGSH